MCRFNSVVEHDDTAAWLFFGCTVVATNIATTSASKARAGTVSARRPVVRPVKPREVGSSYAVIYLLGIGPCSIRCARLLQIFVLFGQYFGDKVILFGQYFGDKVIWWGHL